MTQAVANEAINLEDQITGLLSDPLVEHRRAAAVVIGAIRASSAMVQGLRSALKDESSEVRSVAVEALGRTGAKTLVKDLRPLLKDPVEAVRTSVKRVLAEGPGVETEQLAKMLEAKDEKQKVGAIAVLGARGGDESRSLILSQLSQPSLKVLEAIQEALQPEVDALTPDEVPNFIHDLDATVVELEQEAFERASASLVKLLGGISHGAVTGLLARIAGSQASTEVRVEAVMALRRASRGHRGAQEHAFKVLLSVLEGESLEGSLLGPVTDTLGELDVPMALEPRVRDLTKSEHTVIRRWALQALGSLDSAPAARALAAATIDGDPTDRALAMEASLKTVHGRRALAKTLVGMTDPERARSVVTALEPHAKDLTKALVEALEGAVVEAPAPVAEQIMRLLADRGGAGHLAERAEQLKAAGDWKDAADLFGRIASDTNPAALLGLGICELKQSKKTLGRGPSHDPAVAHFRRLTKHPKFPTVDRLASDPDVTPDELYYLGFSLAEDKSDAVRTLGGDILLGLAERYEEESLGKKAQQKLKTMGWAE